MRTTFAITRWTAFLAIFLAPSVVTILSDMLDEPGGPIAFAPLGNSGDEAPDLSVSLSRGQLTLEWNGEHRGWSMANGDATGPGNEWRQLHDGAGTGLLAVADLSACRVGGAALQGQGKERKNP